MTLALTLGVLELGILFSTLLYGVISVQTFVYAQREIKDTFWMRLMVASVWSFETIHTALSWALLYSFTVTNYGHPSAIQASSWSLASTVPISSVIGAIVQVFFAYRVRVLSGHMFVPAIAWSGALLRVAFGVTLAITVMRYKTLPDFFRHRRWLVTTQLILDAAIDVLNTTSVCIYLLRRKTHLKRTQRLVHRIILCAVETGMLTSLSAVAILACSLLMKTNLIYMSIFMVYPKFFSNSLLVSLNTREALRRIAIANGKESDHPPGSWSESNRDDLTSPGGPEFSLVIMPNSLTTPSATA